MHGGIRGAWLVATFVAGMTTGPAVAQTGACATFGTICVGADAGCHVSSIAEAIAMASSSPAESTTIRIASNAEWNAQNLVVTDRNLLIRGGFSSCASLFPNGRTVISGQGGSGASVLRINASSGFRSVTIRDIELRGGGSTTQSVNGGGLAIQGNAAVTLRNVAVVNNEAQRGGGIHIDGGAGATLRLEVASRVVGNVALQGGGGIYCTGEARITMDDTLVSGNVAGVDPVTTPQAHGGGISLDPCWLNATQGPVESLRGLRLNIAAGFGGGLYATGYLSAVLEGTSGHAFEVVGNLAGGDGGGVAARAGNAFLRNTTLRGNTAGFGAPVRGRGGGVSISQGTLTIRGVDCGDCSRLEDNVALDNTPGGDGVGHAIFVGMPEGSTNSSSARVVRTRILGHGDGKGSLIRAQGDFDPLGAGGLLAQVTLESTLVTGNHVTSLLDLFGDAEAEVESSTLADNNADVVIDSRHQSGPMVLHNTIVRETPGTPLLPDTFEGGFRFDLDIECLLVHRNAENAIGLPSGRDIFQLLVTDDPGFADAPAGNYRLRPGAAAVDHCLSNQEVPALDLEGLPRGVDVPDYSGSIFTSAVNDVGAHELQADFLIFGSGFE